MRLRLLALGLLTVFTFTLPLTAADDKKNKKDDPIITPIDADKLPAGDYTGKLLTTPSTDGTFTLQIDTKSLVPKNPDQLTGKEAKLQTQIQASQQKIANLQGQIAAAKNAKEAAKHNAQLQKETTHLQQLMAQSQIKPQDLKEVIDTKVYDMKLTEAPDFRYMNLPKRFDDDGKEKKYTVAELKELQGKKTTLPGYEGKLDDLKVGQTVKVTLMRIYPKAAPKDTPDAKPDDAKKEDVKADDAKPVDPKKDDTKDPADKKPAERKMQVKMIVILEDAPDDSTDPKGKKKKDK